MRDTRPVPTIGRIVHAKLAQYHVDKIVMARGKNGQIGNPPKEGNIYPAIIVAVWGKTPLSAVNLRVFLDGEDSFWMTSVCVGEDAGSFAWPERAPPAFLSADVK